MTVGNTLTLLHWKFVQTNIRRQLEARSTKAQNLRTGSRAYLFVCICTNIRMVGICWACKGPCSLAGCSSSLPPAFSWAHLSNRPPSSV